MGGADEKGRVDVYSIQGRQVGSYSLHAGNNLLSLDSDLYVSGLFIYKLYVGADLVKTDKLIVID